ncbi:MAG: hypothetical protein FWE11_01845 [Defluviitaleaceae bacterium]|nr:hypothetical protein [Defluviitaleaceae bacterium]
MYKYSQFGAIGDGVTDDFESILKTHAAANEAGVAVTADQNATYYIGGGDMTAVIQTNTHWGNAQFIIDDTSVKNRYRNIFQITSKLQPITLGVTTLRKGQEKLDINLAHDSLVLALDKTTMRYIREGLNQDSGTHQTDIFIVKKDGTVDPNTSILWDYNNVTSITAHPIDPESLTITGGYFTTIANQEAPVYEYFERNIAIQRSNVVIDGLTHAIIEEKDRGAPYGGFLSIASCANITIKNCKLTGHKTYTTIGSANKPVQMGTYDVLAEKAVNLLFQNCRQLNDITDDAYWGIFGSNFTKNIIFDNIVFSRFDAHKGTANLIIKDSELGYMGIQLIGSGSCLIENTKVFCQQFASLRHDYGSTWEGNLTIRNCEFTPHKIQENGTQILGAWFTGQHNFGYPCYMPCQITIDGLIIHDAHHDINYQGPKILADVTSTKEHPYTLPEKIIVKRLTVKSGKPWVLSDNMELYKDVIIETEE